MSGEDSIRLRPALESDSPRVKEIFSECFNPQYVSHTEIQEGRATAEGFPLVGAADLLAAEVLRTITDPGRGIMLVAELGTRIVGFAFSGIETKMGGRYGVCYDLCVLPEARRKGVGRSLITATVSLMETKGVNAVFAESNISNSPAHGLLESLEFRPVSTVFAKIVHLY